MKKNSYFKKNVDSIRNISILFLIGLILILNIMPTCAAESSDNNGITKSQVLLFMMLLVIIFIAIIIILYWFQLKESSRDKETPEVLPLDIEEEREDIIDRELPEKIEPRKKKKRDSGIKITSISKPRTKKGIAHPRDQG